MSNPNMGPAANPFRFGVQANHHNTGTEWTDMAKRVEWFGYSTLTMPDHYDQQFAPIPALQAAADVTNTLRLGALVFDNDYKHPAVLAKELATMDVLSNGRIEIGLGAGWMISDYEQLGIRYDSPGVRVSRMIEGLSVLRSALGPDEFSFAGDHYTITNYNGMPKPVQQLPPVLIGGGGPRVLKFAAEQADIVGINANLVSGKIDGQTLSSMTAQHVDERIGWVTDAATAAGRIGQIELNVRAFMVKVTDDIDAAFTELAAMTGLSDEAIRESPYALVGPPEKIVDDLRQRRERWGFSYVIVGEAEAESFAPVVAVLAGT